MQVEGIAVNKGLVVEEPGRRLKRYTKNISGKVITNTDMKIQRKRKKKKKSMWKDGIPVMTDMR